MLKALLAGTAIALAMTSHSALAQDAPAQDISGDTNEAAANGEQDEEGLVEIVVTAQRREELAQRTGMAIDVLTGDEILTQGVSQATDLGKIVPSLNVQASGGASVSFFLRGVGNFTVNGYSDPALAFIYDGV